VPCEQYEPLADDVVEAALSGAESDHALHRADAGQRPIGRDHAGPQWRERRRRRRVGRAQGGVAVGGGVRVERA
jgi:hypothetical protein